MNTPAHPAWPDRLSDTELAEAIVRHPWFTTARLLRQQRSGIADPAVRLVSAYRTLPLSLLPIDRESLTELSSEELIERFLQEKHPRIVAEEGEPDTEIVTRARFSSEDDLATEELAQIYLAQGLRRQAIDTYRKLSLLNPEKSVYFAEIISEIETNN